LVDCQLDIQGIDNGTDIVADGCCNDGTSPREQYPYRAMTNDGIFEMC